MQTNVNEAHTKHDYVITWQAHTYKYNGYDFFDDALRVLLRSQVISLVIDQQATVLPLHYWKDIFCLVKTTNKFNTESCHIKAHNK